jgi:hypothetical protein
MPVESIPGGNPPSVGYTPELQDNAPMGETSGPGRKQLTPEEAAQLLQALAMVEGQNRSVATTGVPEPETGARSDGVKGMDPALDNASANLQTDIYDFMAMYTKIAQQMRTTAREQRQAELQNQVSSINSQADKMVEAAEKRFTAAMIQGAFQIGGGLMSIGSGLGSLKAMRGHDAIDFQSGSALNNQLQAKQGMAQGMSQSVTGVGSMISASYEKDAAILDSEGKGEEAKGTRAQASREAQQEIVQTMGDLLRDIREQLRSMAQSDIETNRGMARNI